MSDATAFDLLFEAFAQVEAYSNRPPGKFHGVDDDIGGHGLRQYFAPILARKGRLPGLENYKRNIDRFVHDPDERKAHHAAVDDLLAKVKANPDASTKDLAPPAPKPKTKRKPRESGVMARVRKPRVSKSAKVA